MASLKDVAALAGVSPSTVSYVMNGKKQVKPETLESIRKAIKAVNYQPNVVARSLRTKVSKSIGILVADLSNVFYVDVMAGIESVLAPAGYSSIVSNSRNSASVEQANLRELSNRNIDGVIVLGTGGSTPNDFGEFPAPVIYIDRVAGAESCSVSVDNRKGGYLGGKYLLENGKKRIIFIGFHHHLSSSARYNGCLDAYREHGLNAEEYFQYVETVISPEGGYDAVMDLNQKHLLDDCDAIFAATDYAAFGVLKAISDLGMTVPQDIAVMGYDDLYISRYLIPALTTVSQPKFEMGCSAAEMMLNILSNKQFESNIVLQPSLVIRDSV